MLIFHFRLSHRLYLKRNHYLQVEEVSEVQLTVWTVRKRFNAEEKRMSLCLAGIRSSSCVATLVPEKAPLLACSQHPSMHHLLIGILSAE